MKNIYSCILLIIVLGLNCSAQNRDTLFVAFWNLQNLFDTIDDPNKNDESFLPDGEMEWTEDRLDKKMYNLSRVIRSMNNDAGPDLLGVCEVENQAVLEMMISKYLPELNYKCAYIESPDNRGIDNGLIYKAVKFRLLNIQVDTVHLSDRWPTRLVLGVNLLMINDQKLTVFINHWPSRSGGQLQSEPNRIEAARTLFNAADRIFQPEPEANILIIGDFNDDPTNNSVLKSLRAYPIKCDSLNAEIEVESKGQLFNLSYESYERGLGSYKYKETWNMLDQIIVSGSLMVGNEINYICNSFEVYKPSFLITISGPYKGTPFPTYGGRKYLGGYSDHFPVNAKFTVKRKKRNLE